MIAHYKPFYHVCLWQGQKISNFNWWFKKSLGSDSSILGCKQYIFMVLKYSLNKVHKIST